MKPLTNTTTGEIHLTHKQEEHHEHSQGHEYQDEHHHDQEHDHPHHEHVHYDWEEPGYVSLWLGTIKTKPIDDMLVQYLAFEYDEDGNAIHPPFSHDFEIEEFAEDFREAGILDEPKHRIEDMLQGCSYEDEVIPLFQNLIDKTLMLETFNTVILLYNFNYHGKVKHVSNEQMDMIYIGSVQMQQED